MPDSSRPHRRRAVNVAALVSAVALILGVLAPVAASATPTAQAHVPGVLWTGHTTQGELIRFRTVRREGVRSVTSMVALFDVTCAETGEVLNVGFGAEPVDRLDHGALSFDMIVFNNALHWAGTIRTFEAEGTISFALAAFTPDGGLQRCETGVLGWKAHRRPATAAAPAALPRPADGWIRPEGPTLHLRQDRRPRTTPSGSVLGVYFGETQQDIGLFFEVLGSEAQPFLGTYDIAVLAPCPDGDTAVGLQILGFADLPIPDGSWAIDEVGLFSRIHWDGTVATDPARGSLSMAFPAFTPDEELGACDSGNQLWRATAG